MHLIQQIRRCLLGLRAWIHKVQHAIEKYEGSIHARNERQRQKEPPVDKPIKVRAVVSYDDETVRSTKAEAERQYRTQNSIKRAAWSAFFAASIYAAIAACQLHEMRKATTEATTQTKLLSAQLKGTMSATVRLEEPRIT